MMYHHELLFYHNITPLHIGSGQDVGVVDLPIIRERSTGYPFIPGSGIRGTLRDHFEADTARADITLKLFGPAPDSVESEDGFAGCLAIHDARILLFPVRTNKKIFCWITCPLVLKRFNRDIEVFGPNPPLLKFNEVSLAQPGDDNFVGPNDFSNTMYLEEFRFDRNINLTQVQTNLNTWAGLLAPKLSISDLAARLLLVSDQSFWYFVNHATMVMQHNTLTSAKTVKTGALFSVESLPPETIFYGMVGTTIQRKEPDAGGTRLDASQAWAQFKTNLFNTNSHFVTQFGGDEGTGLGVTKIILAA